MTRWIKSVQGQTAGGGQGGLSDLAVCSFFSSIYLEVRSRDAAAEHAAKKLIQRLDKAADELWFVLHLCGYVLHPVRLRGSAANDDGFPSSAERSPLETFSLGRLHWFSSVCDIPLQDWSKLHCWHSEGAQIVQLLQEGTARHSQCECPDCGDDMRGQAATPGDMEGRSEGNNQQQELWQSSKKAPAGHSSACFCELDHFFRLLLD